MSAGERPRSRGDGLRRAVRDGGFTIIELIMVIVIAGVMTAVVVARWPGSELEVYPLAHTLGQNVRYAQSLAMSHTGNFSIRNLGANGYQILDATNSTVHPNSNVTLTGGANISAFNITFNSLGTPSAAGNISISANGATARVLVTATTGAVTVQ
ncbi:MAG: prepilin-type N-terminal cleavage/methylation domain-containing protein [Magnetococcales bacterium]|nr:prepilin-type N-terminal cleavage/methylation domain-containing protein [Magnetococcales bacterium]